MKARLAILLSGRGSNFLSIHEAIEEGRLPAEIVLVGSNRVDAVGLEKARERGLPVACWPSSEVSDRREHERQVLASLDKARVDWVCLAGYMRLLSAQFVAAYPQRIVNIHPSLLPAFPGLDVHRQALEYGVRVAGCTVHLVDEGLDSGPIVEQRAVAVLDDDTEESLAARILEQEHKAYPAALRRLITEAWRLDGRKIVFGSATDDASPEST